jgi:hypothetical protein
MSLSVINADGEGGSQDTLSISLLNSDDVAGFQFVLSDIPDILSFVEVLPTDRTAEFTVSASEGEGGVTLLGFSFTGAVIAPGDGSIVDVVYNLGMVEFDTDVIVSISGSILSDPAGNGIEHGTVDGTFTVYAGELIAPESPSNVSANGGQNSVTVSWDASWQAAGYNVLRDRPYHITISQHIITSCLPRCIP